MEKISGVEKVKWWNGEGDQEAKKWGEIFDKNEFEGRRKWHRWKGELCALHVWRGSDRAGQMVFMNKISHSARVPCAGTLLHPLPFAFILLSLHSTPRLWILLGPVVTKCVGITNSIFDHLRTGFYKACSDKPSILLFNCYLTNQHLSSKVLRATLPST